MTKVTYSCDTRRIQLGKTLNRFLCFINRKCLTVILDWFNRTGKFCYRYGNIQNTEAATGGVLKAFTNFKGNHPSQSLFFDKIAGLRPATVLKKRLWHRCFLWILWNFQEHVFCKRLFIQITFMHREGFICLGLKFQGIDERCCVEDVSFLCQVPSSLLNMKHRAFLISRLILFTH